jgi:hypothetical protein
LAFASREKPFSCHLYLTASLSYTGVMNEPTEFSLDEIAALAELPKRTVRY